MFAATIPDAPLRMSRRPSIAPSLDCERGHDREQGPDVACVQKLVESRCDERAGDGSEERARVRQDGREAAARSRGGDDRGAPQDRADQQEEADRTDHAPLDQRSGVVVVCLLDERRLLGLEPGLRRGRPLPEEPSGPVEAQAFLEQRVPLGDAAAGAPDAVAQEGMIAVLRPPLHAGEPHGRGEQSNGP